MVPSAAAQWLDTAFASFDAAILGAIHTVQQGGAGAILDALAKLFALLGKDGIALILLGLFLLAFPKTRRYGAGVLIAIAVGALMTNIVIKPLIARPRPYADETRILHQWWLEAGAATESDRSFPSGHTTAAMAATTALFFLGDRRKSWLCFLFALGMGLSRIYLVVHYPTDVIAGAVIGFLAGVISYRLVKYFFQKPPKQKTSG